MTVAYNNEREQLCIENNAIRQYRDDAQFEYALLHNLAKREAKPQVAQRIEAEANLWYGQYVAAQAALVSTAPYPQGGTLTMNGG